MQMIASFLAGSILTLLMPVILLLILWSWYWYIAKRIGPAARTRRETESAAGPQAPAGAGGPEGPPAAPERLG